MTGFRAEAGRFGLGVATAVAAYFGVAVHSAIVYQDALTQLQINAHLTAAEAQAMGNAIDAAAIGTTASSDKMAQALAPVAGELTRVTGSALTAADATNMLSAAQSLTESSGGQLQSNLKAITDLLLVYHEKTDSAAQISSSLFQAHSLLGIGVDRLAIMLQRLQPRIAGSGVDMQHLLGIILAITPAVGSGTRAMMMVGSLLQGLTTPTKSAADALKALHVQTTDAQGAFLGFGPVLDNIRAAYLRLASPADRAAFLVAVFGHNANIAKSLVEGGSAAIDAAVASLNNQGTAAEGAAKMNATLGGQLKIIAADVETVTSAIGRALLPVIQQFTTLLVPVVNEITSLIDKNPALVAGLLAAVGAVAALVAGTRLAGPLLRILGGVVGGLGGPVLVVVGGFLLLSKYMSQLPEVLAPVQAAFDDILAAVQGLAPYLGAVFSAIGDFLAGRGTIEAVGQAMSNLATALSAALGRILSDLGSIGSRIVTWAVAMIPTWTSALLRWAQAFVGWVAPMIPKIIAQLGLWGVQIINWLIREIPLVAAALLKWAQAFVAWVVPMIPKALAALVGWAAQVAGWLGNALAGLAATVITWIVDNAGAIAAQLADWTTAFLSWVAPLAVQLLDDLAQLVGGIVVWIGNEVPVLANALGAWAAEFGGWVLNVALPAALDQLNRLIDGLTAWVRDSGNIERITASLATWAAAFIGWAGPVALGIIGAIVATIGREIVTEGPNIALAVISGGAQILAGLAQGIVAHPEVIVGAIGLVFAGAAVMRAIELAGAAAGGVYALALKIGDAIGETVSAAWEAVSTFATELAGAAAGVAYDAAMDLVRLLHDSLAAVWENITEDVGIHAAVGATGAVHGTVYSIAAGAVDALKAALVRAWAFIAGSPEVEASAAAAGAVGGAAYDVGSAAAGAIGSKVRVPFRALSSSESAALASGLEQASGGAVAGEGAAAAGRLAPLLARLRTIGSDIAEAIGGGLSAEAGRIGAAFDNVMGVIGTALGAVRTRIVAFGRDIATAFGTLFSQISETPLVSGLTGLLGRAFGALSGFVKGPLAGLAARLAGGLGEAIGALGDLPIVGPLLGMIGEALVGVGAAAATLSAGAIAAIGAVVGVIVLAILDPRLVGQILGALVGLLRDALGLLGDVASWAGNLASQLGQAVGTFIGNAISQGLPWVIGQIGGFIHDLPGQVADMVRGAFSGVGDTIGGWWDSLTSGFNEGFSAVTGTAQQGADNLAAATTQALDSHRLDVAGAVDNWWTTGTSTTASAIDNWAAETAVQVGTATTTVSSAFNQHAPQLAGSIDDWWMDAERTAVADAKQFPGKVADAIRSTQSAVDSAIDGFMGHVVASIKANSPKVKAALATVAADLKAPPIDTKGLTDYGNALSTLADTLKTSQPALASAMTEIAKDIKTPFEDMTDVQRAAYLSAQQTIAEWQLAQDQLHGNTLAVSEDLKTIDSITSQMQQLNTLSDAYGKQAPTNYNTGVTSVPGLTSVPAVAAVTAAMKAARADAHGWGSDAATGFNSGTTSVPAAKAYPVVDAATAAMKAARADAHGWGYDAAQNWSTGFNAYPTTGLSAISTKLALLYKLQSPAQEGPLSEAGGPEGWGARFGSDFVSGLTSNASLLVETARRMLQGVALAVVSGMAAVRGAFQAASSALTVSAFDWGYNLVEAYARGMRAAVPDVTAAAHAVATVVSKYTRTASPAEEGPLSEGGGPEGWGTRFDQLFASGLRGGAVAAAVQALAASLATPIRPAGIPGASVGALALAPGGAAAPSTLGGPVPVTVKVYLDGSEVKGVISRLLFEEERQYGGPALPGSSF